MSIFWARLSSWWGGVVGGGFGPNILSLLVLIEIRIRLKLGCDNDPKIK